MRLPQGLADLRAADEYSSRNRIRCEGLRKAGEDLVA
jgi:hypothetical protein